MSGFVHLHVHSHFSFMDGAASLDGLIGARGRTRHAGTRAHGPPGALRRDPLLQEGARRRASSRSSAWRCASRRRGSPARRPTCRRTSASPARADGLRAGARRGFHLTLLVRDIDRLPQPVPAAVARARAQRRDDALGGDARATSSGFSEGLIGLSGCPNGEVGAAVLAGPAMARRGGRAAARALLRARRLLHRAHARADAGQPALRRAGSCSLAETLRLPVVATNDVHYVERGDFRLHDVLLGRRCVHARCRGRTTAPNAELYLKPAGEMRRLFADVPGAPATPRSRSRRAATSTSGSGDFHFPSVEVPRGRDAVLGALEAGVARAGGALPADDARGGAAGCSTSSSVIDDARLPGVLPRGRATSCDFARGTRHPLLRPRERGRLDRHVRARHHRRRPHRARPAVRALPQPEPPPDARHRRGLRLRAPRRGHRLHLRALRRASTSRWWPPSTR